MNKRLVQVWSGQVSTVNNSKSSSNSSKEFANGYIYLNKEDGTVLDDNKMLCLANG